MNVRTMLVLALLAMAAGCASDSEATHQSLTMEQTPLSVRRGIERAYPDAKVRKIERETYKETQVVHYQIEVITARGEKAKFELAEDGSLLEEH